MVNNAYDEFLGKLSRLSKQERQVLELRCQGLDYKTIGSRLFISVSAVKQYMSRIYVKLGLDILSRAERTKVLYETVCPLLQRSNEKPGQITEGNDEVFIGEEIPESQPLIIPAYVEDMVDDDEYPIIQITTETKIKPLEIKRKPPRIGPIVLLAGVVLGIVLSTLVYFFILRPIPTVQTSSSPTSTLLPKGTLVPSSTPEISTQIPVIVEKIVIVTATPPPAAQAPTQIPTLPLPTPAIILPFTDNFDNGADPNWQPITSQGTWRVINGKYTQTGERTFQWSYSMVGDSNWQDYTVDVDYSRSLDEAAGAAVIVRAGGTNDLHLAFIIYNYEASWQIWQKGQWQPLVTSDDAPTANGHIKVVVAGSTYTASATGINPLVITDNSTSSGKVGLGVQCRWADECPLFDNFSVK